MFKRIVDTLSKKVEIIAFPGILYGNSFGSSEGLNPVLIKPVL
jgi:hypothetical protein